MRLKSSMFSRSALSKSYSFHLLLWITFCAILLSAGCRSPAGLPSQTDDPLPIPTTSLPLTPTLTTTPALIPPVLLPSPVITLEESSPTQICSPLEGFTLSQLDQTISNPFSPPPIGSDDPHQGVDLADTGPDGVAREGLQVNFVLSGQVAGIIQDRFPYGNAVLVETPLENLPPDWVLKMELPRPGAMPQVRSALTCPEPSLEQDWDADNESLYFLYAHLQTSPSVKVGDQVSCGEHAGVIGSSGNALNPHLHLEARIGPAGAEFASLAHYDVSASLDEMAAYCVWRVSGIFRLLDPMSLFSSP
jgi:murein DD-endopeptidase MepM/ murein hydrolase activator NlpD